jgi:hypothetical protein
VKPDNNMCCGIGIRPYIVAMLPYGDADRLSSRIIIVALGRGLGTSRWKGQREIF